ncbi:MAG: metallophosphoesterase [Deltaproteobacteria bacterium]
MTARKNRQIFHWWLWALCLVPALGVLLLSDYSVQRRLGFALFSLIAFGGFSWARLRLQRTLTERLSGGGLARIYLGIGAPLDLFMVVQLLAARGGTEGHWLEGPISMWIGPVWYSAHALLFVAYLGVGLVRGMLRLWWSFVAKAEPAERAVSPSRRQFLEGTVVAAAGFPFVISLSGIGTSYDFRVEEREIHLPNWPRSLDGLRVAHLSDIHVGGAMDAARLTRVAELTNGARPDVVLHTGDFLTHRDPGFDAPLYPALAKIRAPLGQWACRGNHDFDDRIGFPRKLRQAGVELLVNTQTLLRIDGEEVAVGGLDYVFPQQNRAEEYAVRVEGLGAHDGEPRILLLHDPAQWVHIPENAADLVLSGHTHGGHIGIQFGDRALWTIVGAVGLPDQGIFEREDDTRLFVTRCVGFYGYPLRLGIPPEIALLTLRSA